MEQNAGHGSCGQESGKDRQVHDSRYWGKLSCVFSLGKLVSCTVVEAEIARRYDREYESYLS